MLYTFEDMRAAFFAGAREMENYETFPTSFDFQEFMYEVDVNG